MRYDLAVFIGRFQPFHNAHFEVIQQALNAADNVLVLVGSANQPRDIRNPFTYEERKGMIQKSFPTHDKAALLHILPLEDRKYNDAAWVTQVQEHVDYTCGFAGIPKISAKADIALIGHDKADGTGFYLKMFPQWKSIGAGLRQNGLNSTKIRDLYFKGRLDLTREFWPTGTDKMLLDFEKSEGWNYIQEELSFQRKHDEMWKGSPYPVIFQTVDNLVVQSGNILLVRRRNTPGRGTWALPGGYLNVAESISSASIRELREETKIKVPEAVLRGSIVATRTFDDPLRSTRGRLITNATLYHLKPDFDLPKVKGADDADKAKWWPLSEVKREMMFEDHYDIIHNLTALI